MRIGFLGLGKMGAPMALNLAHYFPVKVWNRTPSKYDALKTAGATIGSSPSQVVQDSDIIFSMLFDEPAMRSVLNHNFKEALKGKILVNTSSISVNFSEYLAQYVQEAGGDFLEMPVSGSAIPAKEGTLIGMLAGDPDVANRVRPALSPITRKAVYCGGIGTGLKTKYAINLYLLTMNASLAESVNLARAQGLDVEVFGQVLDAGPLASRHSGMKMEKVLSGHWSAQASIVDCCNITGLIASAADAVGTEAPIVKLCNSLYEQARSRGLGSEDMIAVTKIFDVSRGDHERDYVGKKEAGGA